MSGAADGPDGAMATMVREVCKNYGWSINALARLLNRDVHDARRWANGQREPDADVMTWLRRLHANPPPVWGR